MTNAIRTISLLGCVLFTATAANAEYYTVMNYPQTTCSPCCTCASTADVEKRLYHDSWRSARHKHNKYSIEEITTTCMGPIYDRPRQNNYSFVKFNHQGDTSRKHYVNLTNDPYYPDMATADDEIMSDSDMNNQY